MAKKKQNKKEKPKGSDKRSSAPKCRGCGKPMTIAYGGIERGSYVCYSCGGY